MSPKSLGIFGRIRIIRKCKKSACHKFRLVAALGMFTEKLQNSFSQMLPEMLPKAHWAEFLKLQRHTFSALASLGLCQLMVGLKVFCKIRYSSGHYG